MGPYLLDHGAELWATYQDRQAGRFQRRANRARTIGERTVGAVTGLGSRRSKRLARFIMEHGPPPFDGSEPHPVQAGLQRVTPEPEPEPIQDLLERREGAFRRKWDRRDREVVVKVRESKPFGVLVMGDPHLDADGCDIALLRRHVELTQSTPGLYGACVGDFTNNWVGRLVREYANQTSSREDAMRLLQWFLSSVDWAWLVMGNHDHWRDGAELWPLLLQRAQVAVSGAYDVKLRLEAEGCAPVRLWCRHAFKGHSMYHKVHGLLRAMRESDYPADVYLQGHHHSWGDMRGERAGRCWTVCQVGTYKRVDSYAASLGYEPDDHGQAYLLIIDPWASGLRRVFGTFDVDSGLELLAERRRAGAA